MWKKRSNIEILVDILKVASEGAKKSQIVYKANLNFKIVNDFLKLLITTGLLSSPQDANRLYKTTEKGLNYINQFEGLKEFITVHGE